MKRLLIILLLFPFFSISQNVYDIKPKKNTLSIEKSNQSSFMDNFPYYEMIDWKPGMRFMSASNIDNKVVWLFGLYPQNLENINKELSWKEFVYEGLEQREVDCPRGRCIRTYLIFSWAGDKYEHMLYGDTTEIRNSHEKNSIHQLIYLDEVDKAKKLLLNKSIYIKTRIWLTTDENENEVNTYGNQKYIPVKIINIGLGTQDGPVKIIFTSINNTKEYCLNVRFSGINKDIGIFGIDFNDAFQFIDPKLEYPKISTSRWLSIQKGLVSAGMTKKECELSWGLPDDINKTTHGSLVKEQWVYSTSSYLYFENGLLTTIQN